MSLPAGTRVGKYVIQRKLAEGGMAEIFLASSFGPEGFEKQVIIKRIRPSFAEDPAFVEMFVSEARLVSKLNHSNIVQIFDFDRHENTFYIAMEYVRGRSLAQAHQRALELSIALTPALAAEIVAEVARGLSFAHRLTEHGQPLGLVHRDVTPQNILLSYDGAVKLTDFGIAKAGTRASTVGMLKGKFAYMSPEQSRGQPVDSRTDIFALGITLWELLSGVRLFDADSDVAVLNAVQERAVVPPAQLNPTVDSNLSGIVMRCLERERGARFQTAQELERALARYLSAAAPGREETDVGAWMHQVFPIESAQTESTEFRRPVIPPVPDGATPSFPSPGGPLAGQVVSGSAPPPAVLENTSRRAGPEVAWDAPTARTPIVLRDVTEEPATQPSEQPRRTKRRALFAGLALAAGFLLAGAFGALLVTRTKAASPGVPLPVSPVVTQLPKLSEPPPAPPPEPAPPSPEQKSPVAQAKPPSVRRHAPKAGSTTSASRQLPPLPKAPTVVTPGTLVLTVHPAGDVFIDGERRRKQDGKVEYQLPAGKHQLEVRGASNWTKEIVVEPNEKTWEWAYR